MLGAARGEGDRALPGGDGRGAAVDAVADGDGAGRRAAAGFRAPLARDAVVDRHGLTEGRRVRESSAVIMARGVGPLTWCGTSAEPGCAGAGVADVGGPEELRSRRGEGDRALAGRDRGGARVASRR